MNQKTLYIKIHTIVCVFILLAASCSSSNVTNLDYGDKSVIIEYKFTDSQSRTLESEGKEQIVDDALILFYNKADGTFQGMAETTKINQGILMFNPPSDLADGEYRLLIAGNAKKYVNKEQINKALEFKEMKQELSGSYTNRIKETLPFSGVLIGVNFEEVFYNKSAVGDKTINGVVLFSRAVSRIDLIHTKQPKRNLKISSVKIYNYRKEGYLYHNDLPKGLVMDELDAYLGVTPVNTTTENSELYQEIKAEIYCFANSNPFPSSHDDKTTCLIIAGKYDKDSNDTFYRININNDDEVQLLKSNFVYRVAISSVKGRGAATEEEAFYNSKVNIEASIIPYEIVPGGNIHAPENNK